MLPLFTNSCHFFSFTTYSHTATDCSFPYKAAVVIKSWLSQYQKQKKSPQKNQQLTVILRNSIFIGHLGSSDLKVKTFSICLIVKNSNQGNISIVSWHGTALNNQVSDFILLILIYGRCSGFGWGGFNFLPSGWYAAMLIIWGCLCYCRGGLAQSQGLFWFLYWQGISGCIGGWEETQPGQMTQTDQRDIPDHVTSYSAYRVRGRRRGHLEWQHASSQVTITCDRALLSEDGSTPACPWQSLNEFLVLLCLRHWLFPINLSLSQPKSFPALTSLILYQIMLVGE